MVALILALALSAPPDPSGFAAVCSRDPTRWRCESAVARRPAAPLLAAPDDGAEVVRTLRWGESVTVDWKTTRTGPAGWLSLGGAWVRTADFAGAYDFRRVVGCWPYARITDEEGDWAAIIEMDARGRVTTFFDDVGLGDEGSVWFTDGFIAIGPELDLRYGYDAASRRLFRLDERRYFDEVTGTEAQGITARRHPSSVLRGCGGGLKLGEHYRGERSRLSIAVETVLKAAPGVSWNESTRIDVDGDGEPDLVQLGWSTDELVVAVARVASLRRADLVTLPLAELERCGQKDFAEARAEPPPAAEDRDAPEAARRMSPRAMPFRVAIGECDALHVFFADGRLQAWRR